MMSDEDQLHLQGGWAQMLENNNIATPNVNLTNFNLNLNAQNLLSSLNSMPPAQVPQAPSFLGANSFQHQGINMQMQPGQLGGQFQQLSHPLMLPMGSIGTSGATGSNPFLNSNNNSFGGVNLLQQQLMQQQLMQQQMIQNLQNQRISNSHFPINQSLLQSLSAAGGMSLPLQPTNVSLDRLKQTNINSAATIQKHLLSGQTHLDRPSMPSLPTIAAMYRDLTKVSLCLPRNVSLIPCSETHKNSCFYNSLQQEPESQEPENHAKDRGKEHSFPTKLFQILEDPENQEYISWLPHGKAWKIHKQHEFEEKVIPLYFRHAKLASFMRQVNGWGFRRTPSGPDQNSYHHQMFVRGFPQLCMEMRRPMHKVRSTGQSQRSQPSAPFSMGQLEFQSRSKLLESNVVPSAVTTTSTTITTTSTPLPQSNAKFPVGLGVTQSLLNVPVGDHDNNIDNDNVDDDSNDDDNDAANDADADKCGDNHQNVISSKGAIPESPKKDDTILSTKVDFRENALGDDHGENGNDGSDDDSNDDSEDDSDSESDF